MSKHRGPSNLLAEISESQWAHADALVNFIRCPKADYSRLVAVVARAIMAAKAEERNACLNEISMIAGVTASASAALAHAYAAIRKRGEP